MPYILTGEESMAERELSKRWKGRRIVAGAAIGAILAVGGCADGLPGGLTADPGAAEAVGPISAAELIKPGPLPEKTLGNPSAPVTIIEYASLGCPLCAVFHKNIFPKFKSAYVDTGKVFYIYREFPIGASSSAAAIAARCAPEARYFAANDKFMANRELWNARDPNPDLLYKIVKDTGLSRTAFDSCMANQKTVVGLDWVKQQGRRFGVKGTPTFFINGRQVRGVMSFEEMRRHIEQHLNNAAKPA